MGNILFQDNPVPKGSNSVLGMMNSVRTSGPSNAVFQNMYASNPSFKAFADSMRGKTPEQAFRENGLDFNSFKHLKW